MFGALSSPIGATEKRHLSKVLSHPSANKILKSPNRPTRGDWELSVPEAGLEPAQPLLTKGF